MDTLTVTSIDIPKVHRSAKTFPTGSTYEGTWDVLGMSGTGVYTYPNGVVYIGEFDDGMFHGEGKLQYPSGLIVKGKFRNGHMLEQTLVFADGLEYTDTDWHYCKKPDRRFTSEYNEGLKPAPISNLTAEMPPRKIPPGHYDTGDGFFNPATSAVYKAEDLSAIIRTPSKREQQWILANCRRAEMEQVGPRKDLYETWVDPVVEPSKPPPPAAPARDTVCFFYSASSSEDTTILDDDEDSDVEVLEDWVSALKSDSTTPIVHQRLRFNSSLAHPPEGANTPSGSVRTAFYNF